MPQGQTALDWVLGDEAAPKQTALDWVLGDESAPAPPDLSIPDIGAQARFSPQASSAESFAPPALEPGLGDYAKQAGSSFTSAALGGFGQIEKAALALPERVDRAKNWLSGIVGKEYSLIGLGEPAEKAARAMLGAQEPAGISLTRQIPEETRSKLGAKITEGTGTLAKAIAPGIPSLEEAAQSSHGFANLSNPAWWATQVPAMAGGLAPALAAGSVLGPPGFVLTMGVQGGEQMHDQVLQATGDEDKAAAAFWAGAAINGALGKVDAAALEGLIRIDAITNGLARKVVSFGASTAAAGGAGTAAGVASKAVEEQLAGKDLDLWKEIQDQLPANVVFALGLSAAGAMRGKGAEAGKAPETPGQAPIEAPPEIGTQTHTIPTSLEPGPSTPIGEHPPLPTDTAALPPETSGAEGSAQLEQAFHDRILEAAQRYHENPSPATRIQLAEAAQPKDPTPPEPPRPAIQKAAQDPTWRDLAATYEKASERGKLDVRDQLQDNLREFLTPQDIKDIATWEPGQAATEQPPAPSTEAPPQTAAEPPQSAAIRKPRAAELRASVEPPPRPQEPAAPPAESKPAEARPSVTSIKNATVDAERQTRGLDPIETTAARGYESHVWPEATKALDENPQAGEELVAELKQKPRPLTDVEDAVLLQTNIAATNESGKVSDLMLKAAEAGDTARVAELAARHSAISDRLLDIENASKHAGTETARGLAARRIMAAEDFSLAAMETAKRVANRGKPLSESQRAEIADIRRRLVAAEKAIAEFQARGETPKAAKQNGKVIQFLSTQADAARARIKARGARAMAGLDPVDLADRVIVGADYLAKDIRAFADWSSKMLGEFGDELKPHLQDIYDRAKTFLESTPKAAGSMQSRETRAANQIAEYRRKIDAKDFEPPPKRETAPPSPELRRLQANLERVRGEWRTGLLKDQLADRSLPEKAMDAIAKWRRGFLLSSPSTLAKLSAAGFERIAIAPVEEAIGAGVSKLAPKLASKAPSEGGASVKIEAHAITEAFTQGMRDAASTLKTGKSDLDVLHGKKALDMPRDVSDFLGAIHGALKAPTKRNAFTRSFEKRTAWAIRNGLDVTDPVVQSRIALDAYRDANRSIFMQDNRLVDAYKRGLQALEAKNKQTGKPSLLGKSAATVAKVMLPIVKIPTNIVAETAQYALGSVYGTAKLAHAYGKGIEKLSPYEADSIMRSIKKGSVGAAGLALGYFGADHLGGYYQRGKRDEGDVPFGSVRAFGVEIPSLLIHNPLLETLQIGATIRRVADSKLRKKDEDTQGLGAGTMAAALGLLEEVPFVREVTELGKMIDPMTRENALGNLVQGMTVPAGISWIARQIDRDERGDKIQRDTKTVGEHVIEGVPGLRETLTEKPEPHRPKLRLNTRSHSPSRR